MKRLAICALAGLTALCGMAADKSLQRRTPADPYSVHNLIKPFDPAPAGAGTSKGAKRNMRSVPAREGASTTAYNAVFESYYEDYVFSFSGGEFFNYAVNVTIDGSTATISNLFNYNADPSNYCAEVDIQGVWDETAHTLTVPTKRNLDEATLVGTFYDELPMALLSGTIGADESLAATDQLVFKLSADGKTLSTDQDFAVMIYQTNGNPYGFKTVYMGGAMKADGAKDELLCYATKLDFGNVYSNLTAKRSLRLFNFGAADMMANLSCKATQFTVPSAQAKVSPMQATTVPVTYAPGAVGSHSGQLIINAMGKTKVVPVSGRAIEAPDYSYLVKQGSMSFVTSADQPFVKHMVGEVATARSNNAQANNNLSFLTVEFDVPEGHIGTFGWEGQATTTVSYGGVPRVLADGEEVRSYSDAYHRNIADKLKFTAGHHSVTFEYLVRYTDYYYPEDDFMYVHGLEVSSEPMADDKAVCLTPDVRFKAAILQEGGILREAIAQLRNEGANELTVTAVRGSEHFSGTVPSYAKAETLGTLDIPLTFTGTAAGQYDETVTLVTSAGEVPVNCSILVREMPDFQSIVKEGSFQFETTEDHPWLIEGGKAYNSTSKVVDTEIVNCKLQAAFNVPEGKIGVLSWKGRLSTSPIDKITDHLMITIASKAGYHQTLVPGEFDLDSDKFPYYESPSPEVRTVPSGDGVIAFNYIQFGDGEYFGDDLAEIYDLSLTLYDAEANAAELLTDSIAFPDTYEGRSNRRFVTLKNTGTDPLVILDGYGENFLALIPEQTAAFQKTIEVPIDFMPGYPGLIEEDVVISTSAGDFTVHCTGTGLSMEGILLLQDFDNIKENDWMTYDRDGDSDSWDTAFNSFGGYTMGHTHSGDDCIVSFSRDRNRSYRPDNWAISPAFHIPAEGATLSWWTAADYGDPSPLGDKYSVYVGLGEPFADGVFDLSKYEAVFSEELTFTEWMQRSVDLNKWAGKQVHVAFRHHDSEGKYMVKVDDVSVRVNEENGIGNVATELRAVRTEYFGIDGRRLQRPLTDGITVVRTTYTDGTVRSRKVVR